MPKEAKNSALKKQRRLLNAHSTSSSDSESSTGSAEFSHVPINNVPDLENLFIQNMNDQINGNNGDQAGFQNQMAELANTLRAIQLQQQQQQTFINQLFTDRNRTDLMRSFATPDPIKSIPPFDGTGKRLLAWLATCERTLNLFTDIATDDQMKCWIRQLCNKLEGKARDVISSAPDIETFEELRQILTSVLAPRQELSYYKSQLWHTRMTENMSVSKYYNKCFEIVQNIKCIAKEKPQYSGDKWPAVSAFIDEDALAAFITGLREPYVGYVQAAKPEDMEAAYAFVCKFQSKEMIINHDRRSKETKQKYTAPTPKYKSFTKEEQPTKQENQTEPMEVGSTKTKLTLRKYNQINNNEIPPDATSESESEDEDADLNFCWGSINRKKT